jgi:hypothetical protein
MQVPAVSTHLVRRRTSAIVKPDSSFVQGVWLSRLGDCGGVLLMLAGLGLCAISEQILEGNSVFGMGSGCLIFVGGLALFVYCMWLQYI